MKFSKSKLKEYNLALTHTIELQDGAPVFQRVATTKSSDRPSVYVWTSTHSYEDEHEILYIGKAGKGVDRRCAQHRSGFIRSTTGNKNSEYLLNVLNDKSVRLWVFTRISDTAAIFEQEVSLYSVEEDALCSALRPRLNRASFPKINSAGVIEKSALENAVADEVPDTISDLVGRRFVEHEQGALDDFIAQVESYSSEQRRTLECMLKILEQHVLSSDHEAKLIRGYTDQLEGLNGITVLGYGYICDKGMMKPNTWVARIFFSDNPRLVFPISKLCQQARVNVEADDRSFSPLNIEEFFNSPDAYLESNSD